MSTRVRPLCPDRGGRGGDRLPPFARGRLAGCERLPLTASNGGGPFKCVEIWLEDRLLVEVLDLAMQRDKANGMTARNWRAMFGLG